MTDFEILLAKYTEARISLDAAEKTILSLREAVLANNHRNDGIVWKGLNNQKVPVTQAIRYVTGFGLARAVAIVNDGRLNGLSLCERDYLMNKFSALGIVTELTSEAN